MLGYDIILGIMKVAIILGWFLSVGLIAVFLYKFKPTARIIKKLFTIC